MGNDKLNFDIEELFAQELAACSDQVGSLSPISQKALRVSGLVLEISPDEAVEVLAAAAAVHILVHAGNNEMRLKAMLDLFKAHLTKVAAIAFEARQERTDATSH